MSIGGNDGGSLKRSQSCTWLNMLQEQRIKAEATPQEKTRPTTPEVSGEDIGNVMVELGRLASKKLRFYSEIEEELMAIFYRRSGYGHKLGKGDPALHR